MVHDKSQIGYQLGTPGYAGLRRDIAAALSQVDRVESGLDGCIMKVSLIDRFDTTNTCVGAEIHFRNVIVISRETIRELKFSGY